MATVEIEPKEFDLIVLGTGLQESLIAGAAAKAGKKVLHLDPAEQYGSHWSAFSLEGFLKWAEREHERATAAAAEGAAPPGSPSDSSGIASGPVLYKDIQLACGDMTVMNQSKDFMVDLAPKAMLCGGKLVEVLVSSGAHNYLDCKLVQGTSLWQHGHLTSIPASRADVFKDRKLSPGDKRKLMRFLKEVLEPEEDRGVAPPADGGQPCSTKFDDRPLVALLEEQGLPHDLQEVILYGLVLASTDQHTAARQAALQPGLISAEEGKAAMAKYIASVGRYGAGTGAFLLPLYGVGEIPQAFCRVAAVGGAIYVLRCPVTEITTAAGAGPQVPPPAVGAELQSHGSTAQAEGRQAPTEPSVADGASPVTSVRTSDGQLLGCSALVGNPETLAALLPASQGLSPRGWLSRCVAITDGPLQDGEPQAMVTIPPRALGAQNPHTIYVLQMSHSAAVAPPGRFLLYFWTSAFSESSTATDDLQPAVHALLRIPSPPPSSAADERCAEGATSAEGSTGAEQQGRLPPAAEPPPLDVRPTVLVVGYYRQAIGVQPSSGQLPPNVALCDLPDGSVDFQQTIERAEELYSSVFPGQTMFSAAPPSGDSASSSAAAAATRDDSDDDDILALGAALQAAGIATCSATDSAAAPDPMGEADTLRTSNEAPLPEVERPAGGQTIMASEPPH